MKNNKMCEECKVKPCFGTTPSSKYCEGCKEIVRKRQMRLKQKEYRAEDLTRKKTNKIKKKWTVRGPISNTGKGTSFND